jgi:hypothetical protein
MPEIIEGRGVILDTDHYDNEILKRANETGVFGIPLNGLNDVNLQLAFVRLTTKRLVTLIDISPEPVKTPSGTQMAFTKIFMLTDEGFKRKRTLALKFPPPLMPAIQTPLVKP